MKAILLLLPTMLALTGCLCPQPSDRTKAQIVEDKKLTQQVKASLHASPVYKFPDVRVYTYKGASQLSGFVLQNTQRQEAAELAREVPGVTEVINNISIFVPAADIGPIQPTASSTYGPHR